MLGAQNGQRAQRAAEGGPAGARKALQDIYNAEDRDLAVKAIKTFVQLYGANFPKAVKKITDDETELLGFYDFPAEHWIHLRTANLIESRRSLAEPAPAPPPWRWSSSSSSPTSNGGGP